MLPQSHTGLIIPERGGNTTHKLACALPQGAPGMFQGRSKETPRSPISSAGAPRAPVSGAGSNEDVARMQRDPRSPINSAGTSRSPVGQFCRRPTETSCTGKHAHCSREVAGRPQGDSEEDPRRPQGRPPVRQAPQDHVSAGQVPRRMLGDPKVTRQFSLCLVRAC